MKRRLAFISILALLLTCGALASPRVALIKIVRGQASLDGQSIKKAAMASQGQVLNVASGSVVSVKLLGSLLETKLTGPKEIVVDAESLSGQAERNERGELLVLDAIGTSAVAGGLLTRTTRRGLSPALPPRRLAKNRYELTLCRGESVRAQPNYTYRFEILDGERVILDESVSDQIQSITFRPRGQFRDGETYRLKLTVLDRTADDPSLATVMVYERDFRFLTPAEQKTIRDAASALDQDYRTNKNPGSLIELAGIYGEFCQYEDLLKTLQRIAEDPTVKPESKNKISEMIPRIQQNVTMPAVGTL